MKGEGFVYSPGHGDVTECIVFDREPDLETVKRGIGGGNLELVPHFHKLPDGRRCVAFCDEDGKTYRKLPINHAATAVWHAQLAPEHHAWLRDVLVGPVLVLTGDDEFMGSL